MAPRNTDHEIDDKQVRPRRPHNPDFPYSTQST